MLSETPMLQLCNFFLRRSITRHKFRMMLRRIFLRDTSWLITHARGSRWWVIQTGVLLVSNLRRRGSPILQGNLFEKEKHHVLHGHPTKKSAVVVVPGSGDSQMTSARVVWSSH